MTSDFPMDRAAQIAAEVLDLHEKGQCLEGETWQANAEAYKAKCISSAAILAVKLQDAIAEIERLQEAKRRALAIADERAKEVVEARAAMKDECAKVADKQGDEFFKASQEKGLPPDAKAQREARAEGCWRVGAVLRRPALAKEKDRDA